MIARMYPNKSWEDEIQTSTRKIEITGYTAITLLIGAFGYWATTAPLAGAAIVSGRIAANGRNIIVQHAEGGIVSLLPVQEGEIVTAGQTLLMLDDTVARTQFNRLTQQWVTLKAQDERLSAERDGALKLKITLNVLSFPRPKNVNDIISEQVNEFDARLDRFNSETVILHQRLATLKEAISGLAAQRDAVEKQSAIVQDETSRKHALLIKGLTNRSEYTQLLRIEAELLGQRGAIDAQIATNRTQIAEAYEQIERLKSQRVEQAVTAINEVRNQLADVEEQIKASEAVLSRTEIKAPVDGIIVTAVVNSKGGFVRPGEKIMEILPTSEATIIDAKLMPHEIDKVKIGQSARLRLIGLNTRTTPEVNAAVTYVSADRLIDEVTHQPYYRTQLKLNEKLPDGISPETLRPGMPVEAHIHTGERTFFEYLTRPIVDSFSRAFTEQ
ncbi:HlyD family type I secretion periplasmic adaptor subunit [Brucella sp. HL-2]|nr:HlyD family type I secretion periplasmic adaptor subunit [Brucella sp. HL-2]MCV9910370.1 HlyD family type I secretion periplasmic adaptor subunit [Brucella sp. HL-2]